MENEKLTLFLKELSELTKKYGLVIEGCGCCGSPRIYDVNSEKDVLEDLTYDFETEAYERW